MNEEEDDMNRFINRDSKLHEEINKLKHSLSNVVKENRNRRKTSLEILGEKIFEWLKWIETKISALISICLACILIYYSNFFKVLYEHSKIDPFYFYSSACFYSLAGAIILYLSVYLPYFKNINDDQWDSYCPNMIPMATFGLIAGMISLIICVWDVWGWLSIPLIILIKWGFLMTVHFAPRGEIGSIICVVLLIAILISGYYIEHEGYFH